LNTKLNILIIGQGISGTMLSWYFQQANVSFKIIDNNIPNTASKCAAGLINPVTGRRIVTTWMIDKIMPFAVNAYHQICKQLNIDVVREKEILDIFATQQMQDAFLNRVAEEAPYLSINNIKIDNLNHHLSVGTIAPAYIIGIKKIIENWLQYLQTNQLIVNEVYDEHLLEIQNETIVYQNQHYSHIIYANGVATAQSKFWKNLPFAPNKGEALIIKCETLNENFIYKKGLTIAPIGNQQFWVGSNYLWDDTNETPTEKFITETIHYLNETLKLPFTILEHKVGIRPANIERRPFVGLHPTFPQIGILSGMGAKGTSLAPYFANELVQHIISNKPLTLEADVLRFSKILQR
jgi:glycine/D-amino acid oxidase-like deaminating enzyme